LRYMPIQEFRHLRRHQNFRNVNETSPETL